MREFVIKRLKREQPLKADIAQNAVNNIDKFYMENSNKWSIDDTHDISCLETSLKSLLEFFAFLREVLAIVKTAEVYHDRERYTHLKQDALNKLLELMNYIRVPIDFASRAKDRLEANIRFQRQERLTYLQLGAGFLTLLVAILALALNLFL